MTTWEGTGTVMVERKMTRLSEVAASCQLLKPLLITLLQTKPYAIGTDLRNATLPHSGLSTFRIFHGASSGPETEAGLLSLMAAICFPWL
jgi:hypothetical protein